MMNLKERLKTGEVLLGTFISLGNPTTTEIVARCNYDWLLLDLEHGIGSEQDILQQLQAIQHTGVTPIIRVEGHQRQRTHKVLDFGAKGIMFPRIDNAEEATQAVKAMYYTPGGLRGVAKMVRASGFGDNFNEYRSGLDKELVGIIQIETESCLHHLDAIAAVPEVDVLFIGPADLSMALGIFGQLDHPLFIEAVDKIIKAATEQHKAVGILLFDTNDFEKYYNKGIRFFACGTDAMFLSKGAKENFSALNKARQKLLAADAII
jgi:4-hydroxy-2-oxoheptanedioate aldolase